MRAPAAAMLRAGATRMSIWNKLVAGFRAMFSAAMRRPPERGVAFAVAVIALSAKMAKADGRVSHDEVRVFRESFHVAHAELAEVARVFDLARRSTAGFETYARRLGRMFADAPIMLEEVLDILFLIAEQDGGIRPSEEAFLEATARAMGLSPDAYRRLRAGRGDGGGGPREILGVGPDAGPAEIRDAWRRLVRELHPDRLEAAGMPREFVAIARDRLVAVNDAYARLRRAPGASGPDAY